MFTTRQALTNIKQEINNNHSILFRRTGVDLALGFRGFRVQEMHKIGSPNRIETPQRGPQKGEPFGNPRTGFTGAGLCWLLGLLEHKNPKREGPRPGCGFGFRGPGCSFWGGPL